MSRSGIYEHSSATRKISMLENRSHYPLSTDCVVFGYAESQLQIALIERKRGPFTGAWALPGGFMEGDETIEEGARRELLEETGIDNIYLKQCGAFSQVDRDPRGRVITLAFFALVDPSQYQLISSGDAARANWWPANALPCLAFDHAAIVESAWSALRVAVSSTPLAFTLLPKLFTLGQLQQFYEQVYKTQIDKRNFRKRVAKLEHVAATGKSTEGAAHRPAQLYTFDSDKYPNQEGNWGTANHQATAIQNEPQ
jgi:8-oxo-dGTP diphosphatase